MKTKYFKVLVKTKEQALILKYKARELPQIDEELIFFYNGENRFVKVTKITKGLLHEIEASEVEGN
jgi:hypothetical protein